jgi:hypothetical protein
LHNFDFIEIIKPIVFIWGMGMKKKKNVFISLFSCILFLCVICFSGQAKATDLEPLQIAKYGGDIINQAWQCGILADKDVFIQMKVVEDKINTSFSKYMLGSIDVKTELRKAFENGSKRKDCSNISNRYHSFMRHLNKLPQGGNYIRKHSYKRTSKGMVSSSSNFRFHNLTDLGDFVLSQKNGPKYAIVGLIVFLLFLRIFFAPTIKAFKKNSPIKYLVLFLNLFLAPTIVGWFIVYAIASVDVRKLQDVGEESPWKSRSLGKDLKNPFTKVDKMPIDDNNACPRCGEPIAYGRKKCPACNYRLEE